MLANVILVLSYIIYWLALCVPTKRSHLLVDTVAELLGELWYILTGNWDGLFCQMSVLLRNLLALVVPKRYLRYFSGYLFAGTLVILCAFWSGWSTVIAIITAALGIMSKMNWSVQAIRLTEAATAVLWTIYMLLCNSIVGATFEALGGIVSIVAYVSYTRRKEKLNEV